MRRLALTALLLAIAAAQPAQARAPNPGELTSFKDWSVACDNLRACVAFGWPAGDGIDQSWIRLARDGGPNDAPSIIIAMVPEDPGKPGVWRLAVDGKPVAGLGPVAFTTDESYRRARVTGPQALALIEALRGGSVMTALQDGQPVAAISLSGLSASLLWIDDHQKRVGTVSALARKGPAPASGIPVAGPAPAIRAGAPASQAGLPKAAPAAITALMGDDCDLENVGPDYQPIIARLGPGKVLWGPVCDAAAYNVTHLFFIADEQGRGAKRVMFPEPPGSNPAAYNSLMNVEYDPNTRILSSFSKGRGLGDCGSDASWVWDGAAFQLLSEKVMSECKGVSSDDWPSIWRARVQ